jgi:hypothetical protein
MELRARREDAIPHVIKRLAHLLIGRLARIGHIPSIDGAASSYT